MGDAPQTDRYRAGAATLATGRGRPYDGGKQVKILLAADCQKRFSNGRGKFRMPLQGPNCHDEAKPGRDSFDLIAIKAFIAG
jgi:hypothetical protein